MFYEEDEISELLKCSYCQVRYSDVIRNLPCGDSICNECARSLELKTSFECKACKKTHVRPSEGFPKNVQLMKLVSKQPKEFYRGKEVENFKHTLTELHEMYETFKMHLSDSRNSVIDYCDKLRADVKNAHKEAVDHLDRMKTKNLKKIDNYENELMESLDDENCVLVNGTSLSLIKENWRRYLLNVEDFHVKWSKYLKQAQVDESVFSRANENVNEMKDKMDKGISEMKKLVFKNKYLKYEPYDFFNFDNYLGSLKLIEPTVATKSKENSRNTSPSATSVPGTSKLSPTENVNKIKDEITIIRSIDDETDHIASLVVLSNGDLASGTGYSDHHDNHTIKIWNVHDGSLKQTIQNAHTSTIYSLIALPHGDLASCSGDKTVKIWKIEDGTLVKTLADHTGQVFSLILISSTMLASCSYDKTIKFWNIAEGSLIRTITGHTNWIYCLALLSNGDLASGSGDNTIKIWNKSDGCLIRTLSDHKDYVTALASLPNDRLASGSGDNTIKIWDVSDGSLLKTLNGHTDAVYSLVLLRNEYLASGSNDITILLWSVNDWTLKKTLIGHLSYIRSMVAVSPNTDQSDGDLVSGSFDNTIKIWKIFS